MKHPLKRLEDIRTHLTQQKCTVEKVMNDTLDSYNSKKLTKKEMKSLMTTSRDLWLNISKDLTETEQLLKAKR